MFVEKIIRQSYTYIPTFLVYQNWAGNKGRKKNHMKKTKTVKVVTTIGKWKNSHLYLANKNTE